MRWLIALCLSGLGILILSGCMGSPVQLNFPLADGNTWTYQGKISYQLGKQAEITPALSFKLTSHQLVRNPRSPFELSLSEEGESLWSFQFLKSVRGLVNAYNDEVWLPTQIKIGKQWSMNIDNETIKLRVRGEASSTVPAGTFPTYLINFRGPGKDNGSIWLDPDIGIVVLDWNAKARGGQATTHLELVSSDLK